MSEWFQIVEVGSIRLWDDEPPAASLTLSCTVAELEAVIDGFPISKPVERKRSHRLDAEVRNANGSVRTVRVYLTTVVPETAAGMLHTGNGEGDWIRVGDSLRLVGFDETY